MNRLLRPGFGRALDWRPGSIWDHKAFPNAVSDWAPHELTVRETSMLTVMNLLTDKDEWRRKVFDGAIVEHWRKEAVTAKGQGFTNAMFDFCIAELRDKAKRHQGTGMVAVLDGQAGAVKSDSIVSAELKEALKAAVKPLEDIPAKQQDWHPGSNEQVLDLVHPSLYPLIYARSRILADCEIGLDDCLSFCGAGEVIKRPPKHEADETMGCTGGGGKAKLWSTKFQWLPAEVRFAGDSHVKMASYINNLHPVHHRKLYSVLEHVIAKAVPLWSLTLGMVKSSYGHVREHNLRVPCPEGAKYAYPPETHQEGPDDYEDEGEDQEDQQGRVLIMPQPREYREMVPPDYDLTKEFAKEGLQVIVKLANIVPTPDKPDYPGGSWHVEGSLNERICATALYYYDCKNVTESQLAFRQCIGMDTLYWDKQYGQDDHSGVEYIYGIKSQGPAMQHVGRLHTREGRLISFPNVFQHQVQPFSLLDRTKPGHRKMVALFLVDPNQRVVSTANVPPQQRDWWQDALPEEVLRRVVDGVEDFPIGLDEAKVIREELMDERRDFREYVQEEFEDNTFNFCEH